MMRTHQWSGSWPTDEYPPDGTLLRYEQASTKSVVIGRIQYLWCRCEPAFLMDNGDHVFPGLDPYEKVTP